MNQIVTQAIILSRTDYGEADRILTLLTPEYGKLRLMAKGVRRVKSKIAGGIELFSVSTITYVPGRGAIGTLISARLSRHYEQIVKDIERTMLGYELIRQLHKVTEDEPEAAYFELMQQAFEALNNSEIQPEIIKLWFAARLLSQGGHAPNLQETEDGQPLKPEQNYQLSLENMRLTSRPDGQLSAHHIKFLRLAFAGNSPKTLQQVQGSSELIANLSPLMASMLKYQLRV